MTRRTFKPLQLMQGSPTIERGRRKPTRRTFRQLSGGQIIPPVPVYGSIYRTMSPASIADYEGVSTATWASGTTGEIAGSLDPETNTNCLYHHFTTPNMRTQSVEHVLNPIRWTCDMPASNGGTYDFWAREPGASPRRVLWDVLLSEIAAPAACAIAPTVLVSGSHATIPTDGAHLQPRVDSGQYSPVPALLPCKVWSIEQRAFLEANLQAIAPTILAWQTPIWTIAYMRHRVNGAAVGELIVNPVLLFSSPIPTLSKGDTYELDVWYRVKATAAEKYNPRQGKACAYIPTTRVSNGSRRHRLAHRPLIEIGGINVAPNFDKTIHTYQLTANGHTGWTLKDGSDGPHKIKPDGLWKSVIRDAFLAWQAPDDTGWFREIQVDFRYEMAVLRLFPGAEMRAAVGSLKPWIEYRPASGSAYRTSVSSTDYGTITIAPAGTFNQAGTTTFNLVNWSSQVNTVAQGIIYHEGVSAGPAFISAFEIPTSFTVARTTQ